MEKHNYTFDLLLSLIIILGFLSFSLCFAAEFKKSKKRELRLDGKLCYLPESEAFELGIAGLVLLFIFQIIGNLLICKECCYSKGDHQSICKPKTPFTLFIFLILSWISFGITLILVGAATSMNQSQELGEGWLDGECYIVRDGVYIGSAILVLISLASIISSAIIAIRQADKGTKQVHAQAE
ncbi:hypothetical protein M9H77_25394 [Catharanthus roseus]|uniref:Uncharacterized protein n=1 Tax=Catharanthus roseus TaxID=4058 RepID=A0ACC0A7N7_CATRO|nr:hypothetical protein M9H77_25394 [Catharanthus roseus]